MSAGEQQLVAAGGAGLLVLNMWTGPTRKTLAAGLFNDNPAPKDQEAAKKALVKLGTSALFVVGATLIAGVSDAWAAAMVTLIVGLMILWSINRYAPSTAAAK